MGLGEAYILGWWDCLALDQLFHRLLLFRLDSKVSLSLKEKLLLARAKLFNLQSKKGSLKVVQKHYDLEPDLYMSFLDPYNQYTCGYFKGTKSLNKAQEQKLELICKKLYLSAKDKILDIGCGWGGFAKYAAKKYRCSVTGITISKKQAEFAKTFTKNLPVEIRVADYRDISGQYEKVLVCGMIEHVGHKNYRTLMKKIHSLLNKDGLFLLHTIGAANSGNIPDPWTTKYIFPNSQIPSMEALIKASDSLFVMEDLHNFGAYYDPTLMAWYKNFEKNWPKFKDKYDEKFHRMFKYYLLVSSGSFRARRNNLWQIVFSKNGVPTGYQTFR